MDSNTETSTTEDSYPSDEELDALFLAEGVDLLDIKSIEHAIAAREAEIESAVDRDAPFVIAHQAWYEALPEGASWDDEPLSCSPETLMLDHQLGRLQEHRHPLHESRLDAELISEGVELADVNSIERAIAAKEAEVAAASERDEPFERAYEAWQHRTSPAGALLGMPLPHSPETMALNEQLMRLRFHRHSID